MNKKLDWTHKEVSITDIRKINKLYILSIDDKKVIPPLLVNERIFNDRLKLYFLKNPENVSRDEILGVKWNMYITKGFYIKFKNENEMKECEMDPEKFYVSYLEISGPLANFSAISKDFDKDIIEK